MLVAKRSKTHGFDRVLILATVLATALFALALVPARALAAEVVDSGTCGSCPWTLDSDGALTIGAGTLASNDANVSNFWPWSKYLSSVYTRDKIKKIVTDGEVVCGRSLFECFAGFDYVWSIDLSGFETSSVTNMGHMFSGCESVVSLDLSGFDTSSVTDMGWMFSSCYYLSSLTLSNWDTSHSLNTSGMFNKCESISSLDLSSWNTSRVTSMVSMFSGCSSLESLDLSGWGTSSVSDMQSMFSGCSSLTSVDIADFDTSSVTSMRGMFWECKRFVSLNLSDWNTSRVTDMSSMFAGCSSLASLDLSNWDTSSVEYMVSMFGGCSSLVSLDLSGWDTSSAKNMYSMFGSCSSLTSLDLSGWDTSSVEDMTYMFEECSSLVSLSIPCLDACSNMCFMFHGCSSLSSLDLSGWDTSRMLNIYEMFSGCVSLVSLDLSGWDTSAVGNMDCMFSGCSSLVSLDISGWDTSSVTRMEEMFSGCASLPSLDLSDWDTSSVTNMVSMFRGCSKLGAVYIAGSWPSSFDGYSMFDGCVSLVGGNGTRYDASHTDAVYARIDTTDTPGYFTAKDFDNAEPGTVLYGRRVKRPVSLSFRCQFDGTSSIDTTWNDSWFSGDFDGYRYNHELGRACSVLAAGAYRRDCIEEDLEKLGFVKISSYCPDEDGGYQDDWDECGCTFAIKTVEGSEKGKYVPVIAIVVRGTIGNGEWLSNFNITSDTPVHTPLTHEGFDKCRTMVFEKFDEWANGLKLGGLDLDNARIFLTGHSRGAAVAGLVAASFDGGHKVAGHEVSPSNVCAYTFASPTTSNLALDSLRYDNVFNVVNPEDIVPKLPLGIWGYQRLGTTFVLPSKTNTGIFRYSSMRREMNSVFQSIAKGKSYLPYPLGSEMATMAVTEFGISIPTVPALYDAGIWSVVGKASNPMSPHDDIEAIIKGFIMHEEDAPAEHALLDLLRQMPLSTPLLVCTLARDNVSGLVFQRSTTADHVEHGHTPETYISWMMALDGVDDFASTHTSLMIACPVDVRVYAPSGELVAEIAGGEVNEGLLDGGLAAWVDGDAKCVELPDEEAYRVVLEPTADGEMDVVLTRSTAEDEALEQLDELRTVLVGKARHERQVLVSVDALLACLTARFRDAHGDGAHVLLFGQAALDEARLLHLGQIGVQLAQAHVEQVGHLALLHLILEHQELEGARLISALFLRRAALVNHRTLALAHQARRFHQGVDQLGVFALLYFLLFFKIAHEATAFLLGHHARQRGCLISVGATSADAVQIFRHYQISRFCHRSPTLACR